jgi:glycosyltransferase involved in cell wall biosynthesis
MAAADVYFQLSRYEGMPYTILDAMRLQRPVVAFDAGGIRDVVLNKETGFLIRQGDVEGAAEAICALLQNGNMRLEMGLKAVRRVDSVFSLSMAVLELQRLYEQSVGEVLAQR